MPASVVELKAKEFENLTQGNMSVVRYVHEFNRLSRYAKEEVNTEAKKQKKFMNGLHPFLKMQLRLVQTKEFQELVDSAITLENDYREVQDDRRKKARVEPRQYQVFRARPGNPAQRFRPNAPPPLRMPSPTFPPVRCGNCGGNYLTSDCRRSKVICFKCGQPGHIST